MELEGEVEMRRKEIEMELSISDELMAGIEELDMKMKKSMKMHTEQCSENKKLMEMIKQ